MRKKSAGLVSLVVATGLGTTLGTPAAAASAAPQRHGCPGVTLRPRPGPDRRPAEPRRGEEAGAARAGRSPRCSTARRRSRSAAPAPWSRSARPGPRRRRAAPRRKPRPSEDQYVELAREKTDKIFVVLAEFGNQRAPELPGPGHRPEHARARRASTGRCTTRSRRPTARRTTRRSGRPTTAAAHYQQLYFGDGRRRRVAEDRTTSASRRAATASTARSPTGSRCRYNEARYGRSNGFPCAEQRLPQHAGTWSATRIDTWVADQQAAGPHRRADQGRPDVLRPVGPQRLRRRRQLQRARRLHRPLPDRPRRRRPGRRRPDPGRGRDLVAPLEGLPEHRPAARPSNQDGGTQIGNTGLWVADYTIQPENGGVSRVRARVRPRPRPAGPLRHRRRRRQRRQLVVADGPEPRVGAEATRASAPAPADLGAWDKLQLGWLDYEIVVAGPDQDARPRPARVQLRQGAGRRRACCRRSRSTTQLGAPYAGTKQWWRGTGDDLDSTMSRAGRRCPRAPPTLTFQANWNIEDCGPDAVRLRLRRGRRRHRLQGRSRATSPSAAEGNGIDGDQRRWTPATFDLSAYAGKTVELRFHYTTDGAAQGNDRAPTPGLFVDDDQA